MDWKRLFDFRGRAKRSEYWLVGLGTWFSLFLIVVLYFGLRVIIGPIATLPAVALFLAAIAIVVAVGVRRLHDRGKSGWWLLLFMLLPVLLSGLAEGMTAGGDPDAAAASLLFSLPSLGLSIWAFVELGCLPAKKGPNKYVAATAPEVVEAFD